MNWMWQEDKEKDERHQDFWSEELGQWAIK